MEAFRFLTVKNECERLVARESVKIRSRVRELIRQEEDEALTEISGANFALILWSRPQDSKASGDQEIENMPFEFDDEYIAECAKVIREMWKEKLRQKGEARLFRRQLEHKFGPLPSATEERIQTAAPPQIVEWSLRILDAQSLDEVFA